MVSYQYETSPKKIKPEYDEPKRSYKRKSTIRKTNNKNQIKTKPISQAKILMYIAIGFAALFVISYRYAVLDNTYAKLKGLKAELAAVEKETAQLEANIESNIKLSTIEEEARDMLGMEKVSAEQKVYVSLPKTDYVESSSEVIKQETNQNWFMQIIDKIMETLK